MTQTTDLTKQPKSATEREPSRVRVSPAVDVYENAQEILMMADLPGVRPENVDVHLDGRSLRVSAWQNTPEPTDRYRASEYERLFRVPDTIDPDGIKAELADGVLTLHLRKADSARPRRIEVTSKH